MEENIREKEKFEKLFLQLVFSLQGAAFMQMGRVPSPVTGDVERDMDQARGTIDMLRMLREKTSSGLAENEKDLLNKTIFELEMSFMEESKKGTLFA